MAKYITNIIESLDNYGKPLYKVEVLSNRGEMLYKLCKYFMFRREATDYIESSE